MNEFKQCTHKNTVKKGLDVRDGLIYQRYKCKDCFANFYMKYNPKEEKESSVSVDRTKKRYVITSAVSNAEVCTPLLRTLEAYCTFHDAQLLIVPIDYNHEGSFNAEYSFPTSIEKYLIRENVNLTSDLKLLAGINLSPAVASPLTGLEPFSHGASLVVGHPRVAVKTLALNHVSKPAIVSTTGCVTLPVYTKTKQGAIAEINHSLSAVVVEVDEEIDSFHLRNLNSSEDGSFYDLDMFYDGYKFERSATLALVVGDEHVKFIDPEVAHATYTSIDSMTAVLNPKSVVRHDVLDFYASNHHHKGNIFNAIAKHDAGMNIIEDELRETIDFLIATTPKHATSYIVSSNHNEALARWLKEVDITKEVWNAKFYFNIMAEMIKRTTMSESGAYYPDPFQLFYELNYPNDNSLVFLSPNKSFKIKDIELSLHGDKGTNGARGSTTGMSRLGSKSISGHTHQPEWVGGAVTVGHSCYSKLEYNKGASGWSVAHCIIHSNGKRQLIFIKDGKWRS